MLLMKNFPADSVVVVLVLVRNAGAHDARDVWGAAMLAGAVQPTVNRDHHHPGPGGVVGVGVVGVGVDGVHHMVAVLKIKRNVCASAK